MSLSRPRTLLIAGCLLLGVFALARFPAAKAFAWFAPAEISAFGVSGTVWSGRARIISTSELQFRNSEWDLSMWRVLLGQLGGDFSTRWGGGFVEASGSVGIGGTISLRDVRGSFDIAQLSGSLGIVDVRGVANLSLSEIELRDNWPTRVVGTGQLNNLSSPLMGSGGAQLIGDIGFEFNANTETDSEIVTGNLKDIGGPLELEGTLVLTPPGNYEISSRLRARETAAEALRNNLNFLGAPEPDGRHIFQLAGSI